MQRNSRVWLLVNSSVLGFGVAALVAAQAGAAGLLAASVLGVGFTAGLYGVLAEAVRRIDDGEAGVRRDRLAEEAGR